MIGIHISDVSYFLEEGTPLDQAVAKKATSIYLVESVSLGTCRLTDLQQHSAIPHLSILNDLLHLISLTFLKHIFYFTLCSFRNKSNS